MLPIRTKINTILSQLSPKWMIITGALLLVVMYSAAFLVPKSVNFSFANATCVRQFTLAPNVQRAVGGDFSVTFDDTLSIFGTTIASAGYCITPESAPEPGTYTAAVAPWGGLIARSHLSVTVPEVPVASTSDIIGQKVSTARPVAIALSSPDVVHEYSVEVDGKRAQCSGEDAELSCDITKLQLRQGASYTAALQRSYEDQAVTLAEGEITTLEPLKLKKASIQHKETIYTIPTSATFTFDETLTESEVLLTKKDSDTPIPVKTEVKGDTLTTTFEPLDRNATYVLTVQQAVGESGASLDQAVSKIFTLSGGPKVKNVSVGDSGVSRTAAIVVTLDQPVKDNIDITQFAIVSGVSAAISMQSETQIVYKINGGDCAAFTLTLKEGVPSGANDEVSAESWQLSSRTMCGTSWTIGSSVQGRPIVAYSFGSGKTTLLFTGAIHGSEPSSYSTMMAFVQHLQRYGTVVPKDKRVVIVPNTNPDGIAMGTRYNANNVNLGRNFPTANWSASIETASGTLPKAGGKTAGSEPETKALMSLTQQLRPRIQVSFHAQGSLVGANKYSDSVAIGQRYADTVGYATMFYNAEAVMGYPMTGEYEDWMGEALGLPAILIELPTLSGNYFNSQWPALQKILSL